MFLVPLVVFLGVKFGFRKSCQCKRNDKYEVCLLSLVTYSFQHSCPAYAAKDIKVLQNRTRVGWDAFEAGGYFRGRAPCTAGAASPLSIRHLG